VHLQINRLVRADARASAQIYAGRPRSDERPLLLLE
jgi:hypothetical protein